MHDLPAVQMRTKLAELEPPREATYAHVYLANRHESARPVFPDNNDIVYDLNR